MVAYPTPGACLVAPDRIGKAARLEVDDARLVARNTHDMTLDVPQTRVDVVAEAAPDHDDGRQPARQRGQVLARAAAWLTTSSEAGRGSTFTLAVPAPPGG
jgi:hypothetical protein